MLSRRADSRPPSYISSDIVAGRNGVCRYWDSNGKPLRSSGGCTYAGTDQCVDVIIPTYGGESCSYCFTKYYSQKFGNHYGDKLRLLRLELKLPLTVLVDNKERRVPRPYP